MDEFIALFTRASKLMRVAADEAMSRHGVRVGQNMVLRALAEADGMTPGELAARLRVATPTVVKSANRMAAAGLLARRRDPADARLVRLHLTDRGRLARGEVERELRELSRSATATLTGAERDHLLRALAKIVDQLAGERGTAVPPEGAGRADGLAAPWELTAPEGLTAPGED